MRDMADGGHASRALNHEVDKDLLELDSSAADSRQGTGSFRTRGKYSRTSKWREHLLGPPQQGVRVESIALHHHACC